MAYQWKNPAAASVRLPVQIDADGNIAIFNDTVAGEKNLTFSNTATSATLEDLMTGDLDAGGGGNIGLFGVFVQYLIGGRYNAIDARRTITQSVEEVA